MPVNHLPASHPYLLCPHACLHLPLAGAHCDLLFQLAGTRDALPIQVIDFIESCSSTFFHSVHEIVCTFLSCCCHDLSSFYNCVRQLLRAISNQTKSLTR